MQYILIIKLEKNYKIRIKKYLKTDFFMKKNFTMKYTSKLYFDIKKVKNIKTSIFYKNT